jgi:hypothetical protein
MGAEETELRERDRCGLSYLFQQSPLVFLVVMSSRLSAGEACAKVFTTQAFEGGICT